jgi:hypothetical protein
MVASAVFVTDLNGKPIIHRNYRGDIPLGRAIERFAKYLVETPDENKKPVFYVDANGDYLVEEQVGGSCVIGTSGSSSSSTHNKPLKSSHHAGIDDLGSSATTSPLDVDSNGHVNTAGETYVYITVRHVTSVVVPVFLLSYPSDSSGLVFVFLLNTIS